MEHQYQYFSSKHDQSEEQSHDLQSQFSITSLIKKTILSLQLASLCSLIFVSTSLLFFLLYSFKSSFSSLSISSVFSFFAFDRSYMFLLCNGILVFLVKSSSTFTSSTNSSAATTTTENFSNIDHQNEKQVDKKITTRYAQQEQIGRVMVSERKEIATSIYLQQGEVKTEDGNLSAHDQDEVLDLLVAEFPADDEQSIVHEIDIDSQYHSSTESVEIEDDEEEEEDELHTAELNERCEEFIRKMKEGIKAEAKQQINHTPAFPFLK